VVAKKKAKAEKSDIKFLGRLTVWRNEAQLILFDLLSFVSRRRSKLNNNSKHNAIFQLLVGTGFSLWRAVFLADQRLEGTASLAAAEKFLTKVVSDNTITYSQEKDTRRWTAGFYIGHIQYRLFHLHNNYGEDLKVPELDELIAEWSPFTEHPFNPQDEREFIDHAIACVKKLVARLAEIVS
jgi:hypothetical protein